MEYQHETGAIIGVNGEVLRIAEGTPGAVQFPSDVIWELHKNRPGVIYAIVHTHPPSFDAMSNIDEQLFKGWAWALYPFPLRMFIISHLKDKEFSVRGWFGQIESKEEWKVRGKKDSRKFITKEEPQVISPIGYFEPWQELLIRESYEVE